MNVRMPDDLARELEAEVAAGRATSVEAVVTRAVRAHLAELSSLRRSLDEAEAEYRSKGGAPWEKVEAEIEEYLRTDD